MFLYLHFKEAFSKNFPNDVNLLYLVFTWMVTANCTKTRRIMISTVQVYICQIWNAQQNICVTSTKWWNLLWTPISDTPQYRIWTLYKYMFCLKNKLLGNTLTFQACFSQPWNSQTHSKCNICGKLIHKKSIARHNQTFHLGVRRYQCICGQKFKWHDQRKRHQEKCCVYVEKTNTIEWFVFERPVNTGEALWFAFPHLHVLRLRSCLIFEFHFCSIRTKILLRKPSPNVTFVGGSFTKRVYEDMNVIIMVWQHLLVIVGWSLNGTVRENSTKQNVVHFYRRYTQ